MSSRDKRMMDGTKMLWHMDRYLALERGERIAPVHIDIGLTKFCNINCIFCYGIYQNKSNEMIRGDILIQMIKDAGEIGVRSIGFIGDGEPTCNPHLWEALYVGKKAGIDMSISTNGVLLDTKERRKAILKNCTWMRFCLAAGDKEGYIKVHRTDRFNIVRKNIEAIVREKKEGKYKTDIGLQAVYVPGLMDEDMIKESKLAVELGVDYFVIKQCSLPEENKVGDVQFNPNLYDSSRTHEILKQCEDMSSDKTKIIPKWNVISQKGIRDYQGCPSIPLISEISGNGDWFPCGYMFGDKPQFKQYKFGNVHNKSLKDIFNSERYWQIIKKMKKFNVQKKCVGCCRQDQVNRDIAYLQDKPMGVNFI